MQTKLNLLILGGTVFLGRHLVETALVRGHHITLFNRGQHGPDLYPQVEKLRGDRDGNLSALEGRRWDAVIDTCGFIPRLVAASAELLASAVEHYTFVSTISVYADFRPAGINEQSPVGTLEDTTTEQITGETYGPLKALCEAAAERAMPGRVFHVRPGLIVGPYDPTDRFTYWVDRVAQGGEVLAPGRPDYLVQIIDGRDLAGWMLDMIERRQSGVFNAVGPVERLTLGHVLEECKLASSSDAYITWVDEDFLLKAGVAPWTEMPLWVPQESGEDQGINEIDCSKAVAAGLQFRPTIATIRDTLAWSAQRSPDRERRAGLPLSREQELLAAWHGRE